MVAVAFVHPDLGIGGAERLICDAALALLKKGHQVKIYTSHHDRLHCFQETKDDRLEVIAVGDWLPRHTFGRLYALWAYIRMIYVSLYLVLFASYDPDVIICDQVSACIPALKISKKAKIMFYCHFPDLLLSTRSSLLKKIYRVPLDWLEEFTTGLADVILVNSNFTALTFRQTFKSLIFKAPVVLYPSLNFESFDKTLETVDLADKIPLSAKYIFLSINRYERKKNLALAINSLQKLKEECNTSTWKSVHLIMAGGYDERVEENKTHYLELESLAHRVGVKDHITFLRSFTDDEKIALLKMSTCLLYTPSNEHFGIVPIESMYMSCPVIACKSGGPLETIAHETTGYLCDPSADSFANAMLLFVENIKLKYELGKKGRQRVIEKFSFNAFTDKLDQTVKTCHDCIRSGIKTTTVFQNQQQQTTKAFQVQQVLQQQRVDNTKERLLFLFICILAVLIVIYRFISLMFW